MKTGTSMRLGTGQTPQDLRLKGNAFAAVSSNGEMNAHGNKDLIAAIGQLMAVASSNNGSLLPVGGDHDEERIYSLSAAQKLDLLISASADDKTWAALGANIAEDVREQASRQGFVNAVAVVNPLRQGEVARVPMPRHQAQAIIATSPSGMDYQLMRDRYYTPPEFELKYNVRVSKLDLGQATHDLLDHAYNDALEGIMTAGDRVWKSAADQTVNKENDLTLIIGRMSPASVARLKTKVTDWNLPANKLILANNFWEDVMADPAWTSALTPVAQYDLLMNGRISTVFGMELITDGFRPDNQRVLERGEMFCISDKEFHATKGSRGGVTSTPTDGANQGETTKGWLLSEIMSFIMPNARSVSKAIRG
jgi:hypothetical protein